jgi:hypothetical protein
MMSSIVTALKALFDMMETYRTRHAAATGPGRGFPAVSNMKIFVIGLSRTGKTSLTQALRMLGYRTVHFPTSFDQFLYHEAATDTSVAYRFEELDRLFPGSKFILTLRDEKAWLTSYTQLRNLQIRIGRNWPMMREAAKVRESIFGTQDFDPEAWIAGYRRHTEHVLKYFAERPGDLLIMDIPSGDGWEKLCPFLGKLIPPAPFPHLNKDSWLGRLPPRLGRMLRTPYVIAAQGYDYLVHRLQALRMKLSDHGQAPA